MCVASNSMSVCEASKLYCCCCVIIVILFMFTLLLLSNNSATLQSAIGQSLSSSVASQQPPPPPSSSSASNATTTSNFLTYNNPILGIQIQYPSNWSVTEISYNPDAANNTIVIISSSSKTASELGNISGVSGSFVPYLDIYVFDSKNISFDKIIGGTINKFQNNENFAIHESKPVTLKGNQQGHMLLYDATVAGDEFFKKLQVFTIFDSKVYVLTFTSQAASFPNYLSLVQKMVNSFEKSQNTKQ
jgi:photosystem II reaction center protein PsbP